MDVRFEHSDLLWPWSGFLALYVYVRAEGKTFNGTATGEASFTIISPPMPGETEERKSKVTLPITVAIIPTPPRQAAPIFMSCKICPHSRHQIILQRLLFLVEVKCCYRHCPVLEPFRVTQKETASAWLIEKLR